jgi:hypothetical protein
MNSKTTSPKASPKPPAGAPLQVQVQCAWCRMWRVDGAWVSLPPTNAQGAVSHGICDPCSIKLLRGLAA